MRVLLVILLLFTYLRVAPSAAQELPHIKLGLNKLGAMTNVWLAARDGIFKKHGLDVEIVEIPLSSQSIMVLQSKAIDIVLQIPGTAMAAFEQGFDMVLVAQNETAGTTPPVSNALVVGAKSKAKTIADLKGMRIGTSSPRGQGFAAIKEILGRNGVNPNDFTLVEAPFTSQADLLRSGQLDAAVVLDPYTTQIVKAGYGRPVSWYMIETIPDQPVGAWWATRAWASRHPAEIAAFRDAILESHDYLNADLARARRLVSEYAGLDTTLVNDMPPIVWKSAIDPAVWQAVADMMFRQGELQRQHSASEFMGK